MKKTAEFGSLDFVPLSVVKRSKKQELSGVLGRNYTIGDLVDALKYAHITLSVWQQMSLEVRRVFLEPYTLPPELKKQCIDGTISSSFFSTGEKLFEEFPKYMKAQFHDYFNNYLTILSFLIRDTKQSPCLCFSTYIMDDKILKGTFVHLGEALLKSPRLPLFEQAAKKRYLLPQESPEQQSEKFSALRVLQKEFIDIYERELPV